MEGKKNPQTRKTISCSVARAPENTNTIGKRRATGPQRCCRGLGTRKCPAEALRWALHNTQAGITSSLTMLCLLCQSGFLGECVKAEGGKTRKTCKVIFQSQPWHSSRWSPFQVILKSWHGAQKLCTKHSFTYSLLWEQENATTNHKATTVVRWKQTLIFL